MQNHKRYIKHSPCSSSPSMQTHRCSGAFQHLGQWLLSWWRERVMHQIRSQWLWENLPALPTRIKQIQWACDVHLDQQLPADHQMHQLHKCFTCFHHIHAINHIYMYILWLIKVVHADSCLKSLWVPVTINENFQLYQKSLLSVKQQGATVASIISFWIEGWIQC